MKYVDGYVIPVPKKNLKAYARIARLCAKVWMDHGALDYKETAADDITPKFGVPFPTLLKTKPGETVVFSYIGFKSKAHRDKVNAAVMKDPRMAGMVEIEMPFDCNRAVCGGFKLLVGV